MTVSRAPGLQEGAGRTLAVKDQNFFVSTVRSHSLPRPWEFSPSAGYSLQARTSQKGHVC